MKKLLLLASLVLFAGCTQKVEPVVSTPSPVVQPITAQVEQKIVSPGVEDRSEIVDFKTDESALALIQRTHTVEVKHFSFGDVANSIDGVVGGKDGRYWIFYINGKMSDIGAGEYKLKNGDVIVWKYQKEGESL